jgi:hypothetical protein
LENIEAQPLAGRITNSYLDGGIEFGARLTKENLLMIKGLDEVDNSKYQERNRAS